MNLKDENSLKALAKGLRRELKTTTGAELSHNQVLELIAKSLGHPSLAAFQATAVDGDADSGPVFTPTELQVQQVAEQVGIDTSMLPKLPPADYKALRSFANTVPELATRYAVAHPAAESSDLRKFASEVTLLAFRLGVQDPMTVNRHSPTFSQLNRFAQCIAGMADERAQALLARRAVAGKAAALAVTVDADADSLQAMGQAAHAVVSAEGGYRNGLLPDMLLAALSVDCPVTKELYPAKLVPAYLRPYRLFNTAGELDVVDLDDPSGPRTFATGLLWKELVGTTERITATALTSGYVSREQDGSVAFDYAGQSDIDWNCQRQVKNTRDKGLWTDGHGNDFPEDACVITPLVQPTWDDLANVRLNVREPLVDAVFRFLRDNGKVKEALEQLQEPQSWFFRFSVEGVPQAAMEQAQRAAGFAVHPAEALKLKELLSA